MYTRSVVRNYTVAEFRANIKQAFDEVLAGETVIIFRGGVEYYLSVNMVRPNLDRPIKFNRLEHDGKSHDIRPDLPKQKPTAEKPSHKTTSKVAEEVSVSERKDFFGSLPVPPDDEEPLTQPIQPVIMKDNEQVKGQIVDLPKKPAKKSEYCKHGNLKKLCKHAECRET
jgi:hypothetical protein